MRMRGRAIAVGIALAACGGDKPVARPTPPQTPSPAATTATAPVARRLVLTIVSATVDATRGDGAPWDDLKRRPASTTAATPGPLGDYVTQHPELDGTPTLLDAGDIPVVRKAAESAAADPVILVETGDRIYRSPVRAGATNAVWKFPVIVEVTDTDVVHMTVIDWDDWASYDVMGDRTITGRELVAGAPIELARFGQVGKLTLVVAAAPDGEARHRVAVASRPTWGETGVHLVAGQDVTIIAAGEVCTKGDDRSKCAGPEGQRHPSDANVKGFERLGHGALLGAVGDTRFAIGRERRFVAPSSGPLWLGVNDRDADNNRGEIEASVTVR